MFVFYIVSKLKILNVKNWRRRFLYIWPKYFLQECLLTSFKKCGKKCQKDHLMYLNLACNNI